MTMPKPRSSHLFLIAVLASPLVGCNASIGSIGHDAKTATQVSQPNAVAQNLRDEMNSQQQQRDSAMTGANQRCADLYRSSRLYGDSQYSPTASYHRYVALSADGRLTEIKAGLVNDRGRTAFQCTMYKGSVRLNSLNSTSGVCTQYDSQYRFISKRDYPDFYVLQPLIEGDKLVFYAKKRQLMSCAFGAVGITRVFSEVDKISGWDSYPLSTQQADGYRGYW